MEQSDLELIRTVPLFHLQAVAKVRHIAFVSQDLISGPEHEVLSPTSSSNSNRIMQDIAEHLFETSAIADVLENLGEFEMRLLKDLIACGGHANSRDLALYLQSAGRSGGEIDVQVTYHEYVTTELVPKVSPGTPQVQPRYPEAHPHGVFEQAVHRLLALGLIFWGKQTRFVSRDYTSGMHDGVLIVPQIVVTVVSQIWSRVHDVTMLDATLPKIIPSERMRTFQRSLYLYWSLVSVSRDGLPLINNGLLARTALRQVCEQMSVAQASAGNEQIRLETDVPALMFIRLLLQRLGLLGIRKNVIYAEDAEDFFTLPLLERVRRCYLAYVDTSFWNELVHLSEINIRPNADPLTPAHDEVVKARQQIMSRLLLEQKDVWHDLSAFIARMRLHVPYLLFPRHYGSRTERYSQGSNPYNWDFRLRRGWLTHREGWHMVEGGFIRAMLLEPLFWLGLVHIGQNGDATGFLLSADAVALMERASDRLFEENDEPVGRLLVQPNFELVALAPVSEGLLVKLDSFAERVSLEYIAQYRLTRASVRRAIQRGLHAETILARLTQVAGDEVPQNVQYSLGEWERQARRVEISSKATLIEVEDSALLDKLFASENAQTLFRRRLTPQLAEVYTHKLSIVQELLWKQSYLPVMSAAPEHDITSAVTVYDMREPQWRLHEDGLLEPFYAVPDFYLVTQAALFCERDEHTGWLRLTENSLHNAFENSIVLEHIIHFLQQYCAGGIPGSLLIRIKLWGGGYTDTQHIYVEHAPLLRLSAEILQDLQSDEELAPLLGSEVTTEQRLVHVAEKDLERVLDLLRQRGLRAR
jgi:Helicase conserved C-terminal domain